MCSPMAASSLKYSRMLGSIWVEKDFEASSIYDTYDEQSLGRMKFEKVPDGSWIRKAERPPAQARGQGQVHLGVKEEAKIQDMEGGLDP